MKKEQFKQIVKNKLVSIKVDRLHKSTRITLNKSKIIEDWFKVISKVELITNPLKIGQKEKREIYYPRDKFIKYEHNNEYYNVMGDLDKFLFCYASINMAILRFVGRKVVIEIDELITKERIKEALNEFNTKVASLYKNRIKPFVAVSTIEVN